MQLTPVDHFVANLKGIDLTEPPFIEDDEFLVKMHAQWEKNVNEVKQISAQLESAIKYTMGK